MCAGSVWVEEKAVYKQVASPNYKDSNCSSSGSFGGSIFFPRLPVVQLQFTGSSVDCLAESCASPRLEKRLLAELPTSGCLLIRKGPGFL